MPTDTQVNDLKINVLTEAQYEQIQSPSDTELYLVPETVDTTPTSGSTNPITSGGVYAALQNIPEQEQSDWNETDTTDPAFIKNKPQNIVTDAGYVHTDNNYTTTEKSKLAGIEAGAEANVQSDWNQTNSSADDFIKNKPDLDATLYEEVTYSQLRTKIDNEQLVEGKKYRITDYVTLLDSGDNPSVSSSYKYKSAQHPFDLVVTATSASTLDCCAQAVLHDGDTYFDAEKLSKLKIWYSVIGNDVEYAHPYNGKGCIYRMVDEFGNDCPYDFHNVMFKRKVNNGVYDEQSGTLTWLYTFDSGFGADVSFNAQFGNNVIKPYIVDDEGGNKNKLMAGTVFLGGGWYNNTIGFRCYEVTIGDTCSSNNIGNDCNDIVLISSSDNVIGAYVTASRISNLQKSAIGPSCGNLNIGSASSQTYFYNIIVAGGNNSLSLAGDGNGSVYYVYVEQGVSGTVTLAGGLSYGMRVGKQSDGSIRIYNEDEPQVQANWNETNSSSPSYIQHKPNLAAVATSGSYNDLTNKPTIPTVPTHRTVNHEQITDSSLGDINLHDGFYFPNAVQDYDGNWYGAVVIGDQVWLGENLRTTHLANGTVITKATTQESENTAYYYDVSESTFNLRERGLLYNFTAANNSFINNFHLPSKSEYIVLSNYVSSQKRYILSDVTSRTAKSLSSTHGWSTSTVDDAVGNEQNANNKTGFGCIPVGYFAGGVLFKNSIASFWNSTVYLTAGIHCAVIAFYDRSSFDFNNYFADQRALSIRLVSDLTPVQFRDWYVKTYGTLQHDVLPMEELSDVKYEWEAKYIPNALTDYDGNSYGAVILGDQVWMAENLRTTHYADGTAVTYKDMTSSQFTLRERGLFYNWPAVMNGASSSTSIPSGVQGVAPTGWHVPSKQEFIKLDNYLQTRPDCWVGDPQNTAKSMASQYGWAESTTEYAVGNDQSLNNNSSLNLIPVGSFQNNTVYALDYAVISNTTEAGSSNTYINPFILGAGSVSPALTALYLKEAYYLNVRCVYNGTPEQFIKMLMDKQVLVYDYSKQAWVNKNVAEALPSMSGNSGKVLAVNSGETGVEWARPVTVYSGSSEPSASLGEDGDIFILAS